MTPDEKERELVLRREVPFARELVWKAMTLPEHTNRWWGPDGFRNEGVTMDFRVGGAWTFEMVGPDGTRYPNHSVFKEILPRPGWSSTMATANGSGSKPPSPCKRQASVPWSLCVSSTPAGNPATR
jgi:uncharacterized protein YndB with AHSA1/START domain